MWFESVSILCNLVVVVLFSIFDLLFSDLNKEE